MHQLPDSLLYLSPYINNDSLFNADDNFKLARTPFRSFPPYINNDSLFFGFSVQMITSKLQEPSRLEIYQNSRKQKMSLVVQLNTGNYVSQTRNLPTLVGPKHTFGR